MALVVRGVGDGFEEVHQPEAEPPDQVGLVVDDLGLQGHVRQVTAAQVGAGPAMHHALVGDQVGRRPGRAARHRCVAAGGLGVVGQSGARLGEDFDVLVEH